jgi:hypothetical protein
MPADGDITFDFNLHSDFEASLAQGEHVKITDEEIDEILSRV